MDGNPRALFEDGAIATASMITVAELKELLQNVPKCQAKDRIVWKGDSPSGVAINVGFTEDHNPLVVIKQSGTKKFLCSTRSDAFPSRQAAEEFMITLAEDFVASRIPENELKIEKDRRLAKQGIKLRMPASQKSKAKAKGAEKSAKKKRDEQVNEQATVDKHGKKEKASWGNCCRDKATEERNTCVF